VRRIDHHLICYRINHAIPVIQVVSTLQDHTRNAKRTTSKTFFTKSSRSDRTFTVIASPSQDVSPEVVASAISPSGKLTAILRETNSAGDKKRFVEVWEGERLEASVNVTKAHGVFYADGQSLPLSLPHPGTQITPNLRSALHTCFFSLRVLVRIHRRGERARERRR
jgi:hypothetical protein